MQALKIVVIVMGVMILAGFAALFAIIAGRLSHPRPAATAAGRAAGPVEIPAGARIESMSLEGERLALDLVLPDGSRRIIVIDLASGRQLRTIPLRAAP